MKRYKGPPLDYRDVKDAVKEVPNSHERLTIYLEMKARIEAEIKRRREEVKYSDLEVEFTDGSTRVYPEIDHLQRESGIMTIQRTLYKEEPYPYINRLDRVVMIFPKQTVDTLNMVNVRAWHWI